MILRNRGYLPHLEPTDAIYFVTFRLAGTIPQTVLQSWRAEKDEVIANAQRQNRALSEYELRRLNYLQSERIEKYLDLGLGDCWLQHPNVAQIICDAFLYFDGTRYLL